MKLDDICAKIETVKNPDRRAVLLEGDLLSCKTLMTFHRKQIKRIIGNCKELQVAIEIEGDEENRRFMRYERQFLCKAIRQNWEMYREEARNYHGKCFVNSAYMRQSPHRRRNTS